MDKIKITGELPSQPLECPVGENGSFPIYHVVINEQADAPGRFTYEIFDRQEKQSETTIDYTELEWERDDPRIAAINLLIHTTCSPEIIAVAINRAAKWYGEPRMLRSHSVAAILKLGLPVDAYNVYTNSTNMHTKRLFTNVFFKEVGVILFDDHSFLKLLDSLAGRGEPVYRNSRNQQIANLGEVIKLRGNLAGVVSRVHHYIPDLKREQVESLFDRDLNKVNPVLGRAYDALMVRAVAIAMDMARIMNSDGFGGVKAVDPYSIRAIVRKELEAELTLLFDNYLYEDMGLFHNRGVNFPEVGDSHRVQLPSGRIGPEIFGHTRRHIIVDGVSYPFRRSIVSCIFPLLVAPR